MGEKDILEKALEGYDEVFADIINVLLFNGREVIKDTELDDILPKSYYKVAGGVREQERDAFKSWKKSGIRVSLLGIENQTEAEDDMPIRIIGYDGAAYRDQIKNNSSDRYPVISVVLYFGRKPWRKAKTLKEAINVPNELDSYVNDYKINLFEISFLSRKQVDLFKSDFRFVADYFVQVRETGKYVSPKIKVKHVEEILELLRVMTGDNRIVESFLDTEERNQNGGEIMGEAWIDVIENRGIEKGIEKIIIGALKNGSSPELISKVNGIPLEEVKRIQEEMLAEA